MRFNLSGNGKEATLHKKVKHLVDEGRDQDALELVKKEMAADPDDWYFPFLLGWIHRTQNNLKEALGFYYQAESIAPDELYIQLAIGDMLLLSQQAEEALPYYESCLEAWPESSEIHSFYGIALSRVGRLEAAQQALEKSCQLSPYNPDARYELVELYHHTSQSDRIKPLLDSYLNEAPDLASAYSLMGDYLIWEEGNCEGACFYFDQALTQFVQSENPGWFRQYLNTVDFPDSMLASYLYALLQCGYHDICQDVIQEYLEPPESTFWKVELTRSAGDLNAALELAAGELAADPGEINLRVKYTELLLIAGRHEEAKVEIQKVLDLLPDSSDMDPWYDATLIVTLLCDGLEDQANQRLEQVEPDYQERTLVNMIHSLTMIKDWAKVIQYSQLVIAANPDNNSALHSLGRAYTEIEQFSDAITYYGKLLERQPNNGIARLELGFVFDKMGELQKAKSQISAALKDNILSVSYQEIAQDWLDNL